mmetsp:Transcript_56355/g.138442  ORF Transcript_56355/g.138442 Transcript_56355/m.138442 type:complete len:371 (+) Transcript_56355:247-1359(+)
MPPYRLFSRHLQKRSVSNKNAVRFDQHRHAEVSHLAAIDKHPLYGHNALLVLCLSNCLVDPLRKRLHVMYSTTQRGVVGVLGVRFAKQIGEQHGVAWYPLHGHDQERAQRHRRRLWLGELVLQQLGHARVVLLHLEQHAICFLETRSVLKVALHERRELLKEVGHFRLVAHPANADALFEPAQQLAIDGEDLFDIGEDGGRRLGRQKRSHRQHKQVDERAQVAHVRALGAQYFLSDEVALALESCVIKRVQHVEHNHVELQLVDLLTERELLLVDGTESTAAATATAAVRGRRVSCREARRDAAAGRRHAHRAVAITTTAARLAIVVSRRERERRQLPRAASSQWWQERPPTAVVAAAAITTATAPRVLE